MEDRCGEEIGGVGWIGEGEPFGLVGGTVGVGVGGGFSLGGGVVAEAGDAPGVVGGFAGGFLEDPIGEELDVGGVGFVGGERGHAGVAVGGGDAAEEDGAGGVSGDDEAVVGVFGSSGGESVDEVGLGDGESEISFPGERFDAGVLVAVGAVDIEVGTDAGFEGVVGFGGADVFWKGVGKIGESVEVAAGEEEGEEVSGGAFDGSGAVELRSVEGEGESGFREVAGVARGAGRDVPGLGLDAIGGVDGELDIFTGGADEGGFGSGFIPFVGNAVDAIGEVGDAADEFGSDEHIGATDAVVEALDGEDVLAVLKEVGEGGNVEVLEGGGAAIGVIAAGFRLPSEGLGWGVVFGRVGVGDALAVEVGDEAVVVLHAEGELADGGGVGDIEGDAEVEGGVLAVEGVAKISAGAEVGEVG